MNANPGPVVVVTGAGSGLGRAITREFLAAGYRVALAGRHLDTLLESADGHPDSLAMTTDVTDPESVHELFDAVQRRWGRVDVLVNNAGTFGPNGSVDEIDPTEWVHTVATNLTGSFLCAAAAIRIMKAQRPRGGRIINNGSISAHSPRPGSAAYTASKHAITGLTKSISLDGRGFGIACGQIDIGNAATEMTAGIAQGARQADGSIRPEPTFDAAHAARAVLAMAALPLDVNVQFMTITATEMPYIGRG
ncbi:SDR family oxidoreductase [Skermania sp. ID1734]|uniref:SDR family oxidoreductase n=1 Tax=Skermania sp. ID1734 TaxID=2597516 RepID=UPI00117E0D42|nr:SDR family oxidoreductase [Skermania sp. ID1734]TSE01687.1 SDR family oxidoreductase [Skermania sp. ID1734]